MGPELLAYDQVHVDAAMSRALSQALSIRDAAYDAYDNLTWASSNAFTASCSHDPEGMERVVADEVGRIDNDSRRRGMMREIR